MPLAREFAPAPEQSQESRRDPSAMPPKSCPRPSTGAAGVKVPRHVVAQVTDKDIAVASRSGLACGPWGRQSAVVSVLLKSDCRATEHACLPKPSRGLAMPSARRRGLTPHANNPRAGASRLCVPPIYYAILFFGHFHSSDQTERWLSNDLLVAILTSCLCP